MKFHKFLPKFTVLLAFFSGFSILAADLIIENPIDSHHRQIKKTHYTHHGNSDSEKDINTEITGTGVVRISSSIVLMSSGTIISGLLCLPLIDVNSKLTRKMNFAGIQNITTFEPYHTTVKTLHYVAHALNGISLTSDLFCEDKIWKTSTEILAFSASVIAPIFTILINIRDSYKLMALSTRLAGKNELQKQIKHNEESIHHTIWHGLCLGTQGAKLLSPIIKKSCQLTISEMEASK